VGRISSRGFRPSFVIRHSSFVIHQRRGGVYIAVLGTSLIVSLLALAALMAQRIQNRPLTNSPDVRQAELNASAAIELALLTMKQNANWRSTQPHGEWFANRATAAGTCSVEVTDSIDSNLANSQDEPVLVRGIGYSGPAQQRMEVMVDPRKQPLACLRSAFAAGDAIDLQGDVLRTDGLLTANQITASSSQVYGSVEAVGISGSVYSGTTTQVNASQRPAMPDWATVFDYYRNNGTQLFYTSLAATTPNLGRNPGMEASSAHWTGSPPLTTLGSALLTPQSGIKRSGILGMQVHTRDYWYSGAAQRIDDYVKPGAQYTIDFWVYYATGAAKNFAISLYTKGTGSAVQVSAGPSTLVPLPLLWTRVTATLTAPAWSGDLEYAFIMVAGADALNTLTFYMDDLSVLENSTGRFMYRKILAPGFNNLYTGAPLNAQGLYWINCGGNRLVIERSRISATLLVVNPGPNSCVDGPVAWSPALPGYPALLVDADNAGDADFTIKATNRPLSEFDNATNFNPAGAFHDEFGQDADMNDIYRSSIRGLVAIEDDLRYSNRSLVRGQILVGDDVDNSSGELEVEYLPEALLNPPPGFWAPYEYERRAGSTRKVVLP
jgi:hypothetical protein